MCDMWNLYSIRTVFTENFLAEFNNAYENSLKNIYVENCYVIMTYRTVNYSAIPSLNRLN